MKKQETLEEAAERLSDRDGFVDGALFGAKWQAERMYSKEEVYVLLIRLASDLTFSKHKEFINTKEWFEQFKKK